MSSTRLCIKEATMLETATHPNNALIAGAIFEGPYAGRLVHRTAAEWVQIFRCHRARVAIGKARYGVEGAVYREASNIVWHFRSVEAA
jgi:hypothetical protein